MQNSTAILSSILIPLLLLAQPIIADEYVSKAVAETLYQAPLEGVKGKEMTVKRFSFPPKFVGGKHTHPGPVFVYVLEGEFTVVLKDGAKTFKAGDLYAEEIDSPMVAKNMSSTEGVKLLVFQVGDVGKPMMIKVD